MQKTKQPDTASLAKDIEGLRGTVSRLERQIRDLRNRLDNANIP
jgi:hypothetical protein